MRCARALCAPLLLLFGGAFLASCASASLNTTTTVATTPTVNIVSIDGTSLSTVKSSAPIVLTTTTKKPTTTKTVTAASTEEVAMQKQDGKKAQKKSHAVDVKTTTTTTETTTTVVVPTMKNGSVRTKTTNSATKSTSTVKTATRIVATLKTTTSAQSTTVPTTTTPTSSAVPETTITTTYSIAPTSTRTTTTVTAYEPKTKSPVAFVVDNEEDSSQDVTTNTTVGANTDDVPVSFPHFIHHSQFGTKVRLCTCKEADHCANEAFIHLDACKRRCIVTLEEYNRLEPEELIECFPDMDEELVALERCVRSNVNNMCSKNDSVIVYIDPSPHIGGTAAADNNNSTSMFSYFAVTDPLEGVSRHGVQVKKARKTFIRLRSYQKCTARCVLEKSVTCQHESKCMAYLPPVEQLDLILTECEGTKFYKHSHDSCKCMAHTKSVRKLIGICPFMLNRAVLRRL